MGYMDGFRDARRGMSHRSRQSFRRPSPHHFRNRERPRSAQNNGPDYSDYGDYETQNIGFNDYQQINERTDLREGQRERQSERQRGRQREIQGNVENYGNIFGMDSQVLNRGLTGMTGNNCRKLIKPEFGTCIERAANSLDVNTKENHLSESNCKALWDLMCCSTDLISKMCTDNDLKATEIGFRSIQNMLEVKACTNSPRNTFQCSNNYNNNTQEIHESQHETDE